jgi:ABC-type multidrug transport system fused ATPase/permease subunit
MSKKALIEEQTLPAAPTEPLPEDNGCPLIVKEEVDEHPAVTALLKKYVCGQSCQVWLGMLWLFFAQISDVLYPLQFGLILDYLTAAELSGDKADPNYTKVNWMVLWLILILLVSAIFRGLQGELFVRVSVSILNKVRDDLFWAIMCKDTKFFDSNKTGELLSALTADCEVIQNCFQMNIDMTVSSLYVLGMNTTIMLFLSPTLTGWTFLSMTPLLVMIMFYAKMYRYFGKETQLRKKALSNVSQECFANIRTVKTFASEQTEAEKYEEYNL